MVNNINPSQFPEKNTRFELPLSANDKKPSRSTKNWNMRQQNFGLNQRTQQQNLVNIISALPRIVADCA